MSILAGTWNLTKTSSEASEESFLLPGHEESTFEHDGRKLVAPEEFAPGGKYRAVVKLQMRYEHQTTDDMRWAMGTGWLIRPDLLVTAGHCAFDWKEGGGLGRCVQVKAYIGYNGKDSINSSNCQFRAGKKVITTGSWLKSATNRTNDVSFIQLDRAFTGVTPFKYNPTPVQGQEVLGVVGYPGDKRLNNQNDGERGAQMYEEFMNVNWNLEFAANNMLEYRINTYAGQSGSPVIRQGRNASIGAHVYGGTGNNSASPIAGRYGNPYEAFIAAFDQEFTFTRTVAGINYMTLPVSTTEMEYGSEEDFWSTFKDIVKIGAPIASNVLTAGSPFLGPVGAPIAALAGAALGAAGKAAESGFSEQPTMGQGYAERAILAESALQAVLEMSDEQVRESGIFDHMKDLFGKLANQTKTIGPKILPVVMEPALRIALDSLHKTETGTESEFYPGTSRRMPLKLPPGVVSSRLDPFTKKLLEPTLRQTNEESFWNSLGSIIHKAATHINIAHGTMNALGQAIPKSESSIEASPTDRHFEILCKRAIMGEAALQALQQVAPEALEEEGFMDLVKSTVQKFGPTVIKLAPTVIKSVLPLVGSLAGGGESGFGETGMRPSMSGLRRPKSKMSFRDAVEGKSSHSM